MSLDLSLQVCITGNQYGFILYHLPAAGRLEACEKSRLGGEEFGVLMPKTRITDAKTVAERMRCLIAETGMDLDGDRVSMTVSVGAAEYVEDMGSIDDLLKCADDAMYRAKAKGRNCVATNS